MSRSFPRTVWSRLGSFRSRVIPELSLSTQESIAGWLFSLPKILVILGVLFGPLLFGIYISFTHSNLYNLPGEFVGLENYAWLLGYDVWWKSVFNVLLMGAILIPANLFLALTTSLLLMDRIRGNYLYRVAYLVPVAGPPIIWAIVWKFLLFPNQTGIINYSLIQLGAIDSSVPWLTSTELALPSVIFSQLWGFGISMLIYMAALSGIPKSLLESAELDGANRWNRLKCVIWPLLKPTTFFLLVIQLINVLRIGFGAIFVMTKGGPIDSTMVPSYLIYELAFEYNSFGRSAAASMVMFALTLIITLLLWKPLQSRAEYYQ